jgi:transcriptional regulator with XRE-family HTH domain
MATLKVPSLGDYIREQRESAQVSLRQLARTAGVSNPYLSQIERGLKKPSAEILQQIAKGLRISAETLYVRAGILDEAHGASDVTAAVLTDPTIGERHKRVLIDIYESFRAEHAAGLASATAVATVRKSTANKSTAKKSAAKRSTAKKPAKKPATTTTATTAARTTNSRRSS